MKFKTYAVFVIASMLSMHINSMQNFQHNIGNKKLIPPTNELLNAAKDGNICQLQKLLDNPNCNINPIEDKQGTALCAAIGECNPDTNARSNTRCTILI